eukprot:Rhum_TRINITY_DN2795_c0_g1::Rhum_TRINITY_DN2795_c0_g1_i1::g.8353::m.8353
MRSKQGDLPCHRYTRVSTASVTSSLCRPAQLGGGPRPQRLKPGDTAFLDFSEGDALRRAGLGHVKHKLHFESVRLLERNARTLIAGRIAQWRKGSHPVSLGRLRQEKLVEDESQSVHVRRLPHRCLLRTLRRCLLGRRVQRLAGAPAVGSLPVRSRRHGAERKVAHPPRAGAVLGRRLREHVRRLQVAVDEPGRVQVHGALRKLHEQREVVPPAHAPARGQPACERPVGTERSGGEQVREAVALQADRGVALRKRLQRAQRARHALVAGSAGARRRLDAAVVAQVLEPRSGGGRHVRVRVKLGEPRHRRQRRLVLLLDACVALHLQTHLPHRVGPAVHRVLRLPHRAVFAAPETAVLGVQLAVLVVVAGELCCFGHRRQRRNKRRLAPGGSVVCHVRFRLPSNEVQIL